uniref:Aspartyl protease family protein n=1 Tax=Candidatus Kentrum eta TaxID=2126337 RepID=A0A450UVH8_9GAMM|nr:MAG: aspartyl protease family protein [Candidatus Kentron sp. H]VFJ90175.1 MAG: aspartyl protease family protein [Candidatus Kentron sp. H]VFJ96547.1 MAG: aspartyl protease family protein [Candidatus Kentron sp. H]
MPSYKKQTPRRPAPGKRMGIGMIAAAWVILLGLLTAVFSHWLYQQENPNPRPSGTLTANGTREVVLLRNRQGHYVATGAIDGQPVRFLLDTGATTVSVPADLAESLDLPTGPPSMTQTANGIVTTYHTRLNEVRLGNIVLRDVRANINPHMPSGAVLLGMSFLKQIEFTQQGDRLTLRQ